MFKRLKRICVLTITCLFALLALTACGDRAVSMLEIQEGTLKYTYEQGETVSFDGLVIVAKYNDETQERVRFGDDGLTVSEISTEKIGKKKLTIAYNGISVTVDINVVEPSDSTKVIRKINALPSVNQITLANKNTIIEIRTAYEDLSQTSKAKVTNYAVLQAAEEKIALIELNNYKESKKLEVANYKVQTNYSSEGWNAILEFITTANIEIEAAATNDGVNNAVNKAKASMDTVATIVQELVAYKSQKISELNAYVSENDYSADKWTSVQILIANGTNSINQATNKQEVDTALANAKTSIDGVETKAQALETYKNTKKLEIANYKSQSDYSAENWALIQEYVTTANNLIDALTSITTIDAYVAQCKNSINGVKVIAVTNVETLINNLKNVEELTIDDRASVEAARTAYDALSAANRNLVENREKLEEAEARLAELDFEGYKTSKKAELDSYVNLNNYNETNKNTITDYMQEAKTAIDAAINTTQVDNAVNSAKTNIDLVKIKKITDVEETIASIIIDELTTSISDKAKVTNARSAYNALEENEKALVNNYAHLQQAEAKMAELELNEYKTAAIATLSTYKNITNYNQSKWNEILEILADATARINSASNTANVDLMVENAKNSMDLVKVKAITDVEDLINLIPNANDIVLSDETKIINAREAYDELDNTSKGKVSNYTNLQTAETKLSELKLAKAKADAKSALDTYKNESNYSPTAWRQITNFINSGKTAIDSETSISAVNQRLDIVKAEIDEIKDKNSEDHYVISGWEEPKNIASLNKTQFKVTNKMHIVGDDNDFIFKPNITALYSASQPTPVKETINEYRTASKIYLCTDEACSTKTLLEGTSLTNYLEDVGEYTFSYNFTNQAINNIFKIEISPYWQQDDFVQSIIVKVVDGYNVYSAKEMGVMVNSYTKDHSYNANRANEYVNAWKTFLANNNITTQTANGLVIQNNISIKSNDIPDIFKTTSGSVTYLNDYANIYSRMVEQNEEFTIYGNYYTIDTSDIPLVNTTTAGDKVSHSTLFKFRFNVDRYCPDTSCSDDNISGSATMKDLNIIGNNPIFYEADGETVRDPETDKEKQAGYGGMMMEKSQYINMTLDNMLISDFFINIYADDGERADGKLTVKNVIATNAFQNILFTWGGTTIDIIDSTLEKCGGPVIIAQHNYKNEGTVSTVGIPVINITNSKVESKVTGQENWFTPYTSMVSTVQVFNGFFSANPFVGEDGKMNIVAVYMSSSASITNIPLDSQGKLTIDNTVVLNKLSGETTIFNNTTPVDSNGTTLGQTISGYYTQGAPIFCTDEGAIGIFGGERVGMISIPGTGSLNSTTAKYLTMYYNGLYMTFELQGAGA